MNKLWTAQADYVRATQISLAMRRLAHTTGNKRHRRDAEICRLIAKERLACVRSLRAMQQRAKAPP